MSLREAHSKESLISDCSFESSYSESLGASNEKLNKEVASLEDKSDSVGLETSLAAQLSRVNMGPQISKQMDLPKFRLSEIVHTNEETEPSPVSSHIH